VLDGTGTQSAMLIRWQMSGMAATEGAHSGRTRHGFDRASASALLLLCVRELNTRTFFSSAAGPGDFAAVQGRDVVSQFD